MPVYLERYSRLKSPIQGVEAAYFVKHQRDWLEKVAPKTAERYRDSPHGIWNTLRIARANSMASYLVRTSPAEPPRGFATIIFGQTLNYRGHENSPGWCGHDLDYRLGETASDELHDETGKALIAATRKALRKGHASTFSTRPRGDTSGPRKEWCAPILVEQPVGGHSDINRGLHPFTTPVGEPGVIVVAGDETHSLDVAPVDQVIQLRQGTLSINGRFETPQPPRDYGLTIE